MVVKIFGITSVIFLLTGFSFVSASSSAKAIEPANKTETSHEVSYVKPGAAVEVLHDYDGQTPKGEIESLTVTVNHIYEAGYLTVRLLPTQGLQIHSDMTPQQMKLHAGLKLSFPVQFSSMTEGTYYLGLEAVYESLESEQSRRVISVPVTIGSKKTGKFQPAKITDRKVATDGIIVLPAREIIK